MGLLVELKLRGAYYWTVNQTRKSKNDISSYKSQYHSIRFGSVKFSMKPTITVFTIRFKMRFKMLFGIIFLQIYFGWVFKLIVSGCRSSQICSSSGNHRLCLQNRLKIILISFFSDCVDVNFHSGICAAGNREYKYFIKKG